MIAVGISVMDMNKNEVASFTCFMKAEDDDWEKGAWTNSGQNTRTQRNILLNA